MYLWMLVGCRIVAEQNMAKIQTNRGKNRDLLEVR